MQLTGAQIVIECLKEQGVDTIFGYPGGAILNVYDELYKHRNEIRHVLSSHEQGASHAADGYARSTGKVGVCFATSGPGATNLVTGIATAYMDSVPMVAITCNVTVPLLGKDSFQEIDIAGITTPITKHNFIVTDVKELADVIRRAFRIAQTGRPGPVLVDIPKDITAQKTEYKAKEIQPVERLTQKMTEEDIEQAVSYIRHAKKPYIFVGGGAVISEASEELKEFVELVDAPVTDTLMGKGAYDGTGERYTGMLGMHGTKTSNLGVSECDLLIAIGVRFSDRVIGNAKKFAHHAKILQFDVDPAEVNKNIVVDACVMGDVREILKRVISEASEELKEFVELVDAPVTDTLMGKGAYDGTGERYTGMLGMHGTKTSNLGVSECDLLIAIGVRFSDRVIGNAKKFAHHAKILQFDVDPAEVNKNIVVDACVMGDVREILKRVNERLEPMEHKEWMEHILEYKKQYPLTYHPQGLSGPYMIEKIYELTNGDATIVTEVGQHQMWSAQFYKYSKPRTLITSGGLGTMGYGLGAAIGAQIGNPEKTVINIAGDGCFRMNMNEIATAVREQLPLIQVVVNNHVLGMVRQWQDLFYEQRYSATVLNDAVDFVKMAEAMGATGIRATNREEFDAAMKQALTMKTPVVIDAIIDCDDKVWPMVAPGAAISEVFTEEDLEKKER